MSSCLSWNGRDAVAQADKAPQPSAHDLRVDAQLSLVAGQPARCHAAVGIVESAGNHTRSAPGDRVVCVTDQAASQLTLSSKKCASIGDLSPEKALLMPPVARLLRLMQNLPLDLGWTAVVTGQDWEASLARQVAAFAGALQVLPCHQGSVQRVAVGSDDAAPEATPERLETTLDGIAGPIIGIDTTTHPAEIQSLLSALPARSTVALHGSGGGGVTAVNFYLDVHRKNMSIVGNSAQLQPDDLLRARALLEANRFELESWPQLEAAVDMKPHLPATTPGILRWSQT